MKFDWEDFKTSNDIAINCETEEEAIDFCKKMHEHGMKWSIGSSYLEVTYWEIYEEGKICYTSDGTATDLEYCKNYGYTVLEWSDYME